MIIPQERWGECLKCEHFYDDDGGLYCELKECEKATYSGTIRITLEELLELPAPAESIERFVKIGILPELSDDEYYDVKTAINAKLIEIALGGDIEAIKYIDELTGESPTLKLKERELDILRKAVS